MSLPSFTGCCSFKHEELRVLLWRFFLNRSSKAILTYASGAQRFSFSPERCIVGRNDLRIEGRALGGQWVVATSQDDTEWGVTLYERRPPSEVKPGFWPQWVRGARCSEESSFIQRLASGWIYARPVGSETLHFYTNRRPLNVRPLRFTLGGIMEIEGVTEEGIPVTAVLRNERMKEWILFRFPEESAA